MSDVTTVVAGGIRTLDGSSFQRSVLEGTGRIAVEFMSYGCAYCRAIEPIVRHVAETIEADEAVFRVNIAAEPELAARYHIAGTPTFIMFLDGSEVGRAEGPDPSLPGVMDAITGPFVA